MSFVFRAATLAATTLCAAALIGTTPGIAQELDRANLSTLNAVTLPQVPIAETAAEARTTAQPAVFQTVQSLPDDYVPADQIDEADADADADFGSLAQAVAAQDHEISGEELRCLASGVFFESNGEPLAGQLAVAQTILNRTKSGRFPRSICSVLTQRGQFSFVRGGVVPNAEGRNGWKTAVAVAKVAHRDLWDGGAADDALFFHARRVSPGWQKTRLAAIGNHIFYR
ncbi:cell wall hydrolase [Sphingomonas sp.]|uniref:cell wall hydrolase n=1 Tax=Sphingomonas sp. TaxID=28214 RepID=UPI002DD65845|nr:cell wall hydrolase [Sphingomonas sp.]